MHTRNTVKVMLAVFVGGFAGAMIALQFTVNFWWIGLMAGGLIGYLAYDPIQAIKAIPTAASTAWKHSSGSLSTYFKFMFKEWHNLLRGSWLIFLIIFWMFSFLYVASGFDSIDGMSFKAAFIMIASFTFIFGQLFGAILSATSLDKTSNAMFTILIKYLNPLRVFGYSLPRGLWYGRILLLKFTATFTVTLFKLIHSDLRLLCGIDAAIGAAIGYFTINPLLGATIGAAWGLFNYWLISVKLLKLVPVRQGL